MSQYVIRICVLNVDKKLLEAFPGECEYAIPRDGSLPNLKEAKNSFLKILNIIISINYPIPDQKTSYSKILSYHLFHFTYHKIFWELSFITHKHIKRTTTTSFTSH